MSTTEHSLRRRALYTGLQPHLRDSELMEALILWETSYARQGKFSLRYFVGDLTKHLSREGDAKTLLLSLVSTLALPDKELLPDPVEAIDAYKQNRSPLSYTFPQKVPEIEAFKLLIEKWLGLADSAAASAIEHAVISGVNRLDIAPQFAAEFKRWIHNRKQTLSGSLVNVKDLRQIINLVYIAFCEQIGPISTDQLLGDAVRRLKTNGGAQYAAVFNKLL